MLFIWRSGKQTFGKKFLNVVEIGRVYIDQQCEIFGILSSCEEEDKGRFLSNPLISKQVKRSQYEEEVLIKWKCHTVLRLIEKFNVELNTNFFIQKYIFWHEEWLRLAEELTNTYAPRCYFIKWKIHLHYHIFFWSKQSSKVIAKTSANFHGQESVGSTWNSHHSYAYFISKFWNMKLICIQCSWTRFLREIVRNVFATLSHSNDEVFLWK